MSKLFIRLSSLYTSISLTLGEIRLSYLVVVHHHLGEFAENLWVRFAYDEFAFRGTVFLGPAASEDEIVSIESECTASQSLAKRCNCQGPSQIQSSFCQEGNWW